MPRWLKIAVVVLAVLLFIAAVTVVWTYRAIARSVPLLDGEVEVGGLAFPVSIERDGLGVPTIRASDRLDVARALGFLHAQERFFQMDLMRRQAAGELSELFGAGALNADRASRFHRFRHRARARVDELADVQRKVLTAYTQGVNAGLESIDGRPFEYVLLRIDPEPWTEEDSVLALFSMYFTLNDATGGRESARGLVHDLLPAELATFLTPAGTEWDAPIVGEAFEVPSIPTLEETTEDFVAASHQGIHTDFLEGASVIGSNNWAVAGSRTTDGRAIFANDMHLPLAVPTTWYRVMLEWPADDGCGPSHRMIGLTLPGSLAVVGGSNTHVAWGFTNSYGDWTDLVIVEVDPDNPERYRTPDGWRDMERTVETILVRGAEPEAFEVVETIWGPIIDHDHLDRPRAIRWIAHDPGGADLGLLGLEHVRTVEEALDVANRSGIPPQNFVCADSGGRIAWTIIGAIPRRVGQPGPIPVSWADGTNAWDGWLEPERYPRIIDPPGGLLWSANARVVGGEMLELIGDGGYDLGARARQIRDDLRALEGATETDMLAVQLDDRALFLERWRGLLLDLLDDDAVRDHPQREEFRDLVEITWTGRASLDSVAYRLVRAFRMFTFERVYGWLTAACGAADEDFSVYRLPQKEGPLWRLVTERPQHLLDRNAESWRHVLLAAVDETIDAYAERGAPLAEQTWGDRNTLAMRHPLSRAVPALSRWLDMPRRQLPGDSKMPRVQSPGFGASQRMAVSPGHETEAYFHMPGGQSGHPLSPYYRAGHDAWVEGEATPLLPGPSEHALSLVPPAQ
jgi:penicillin amidase